MRRPFSLVLALSPIIGCQQVPYTGRSHLVLVPSSQELNLGESAYKDALSKAKVSNDPEGTAMVRRVGDRIAKAADRPDYHWEFTLLDDPKTVNAWCLPGGKVAVYSGLLPIAKDDDGLAVVLGHEISHALARHGSERMSQGLIAQFGSAALSVAMSNNSALTQRIAQQAYGVGSQAGVLLPFSRKQESEADHIGLILMSKAGYDPAKAVEFWQRMSKATGGGPTGLRRYLATHPPDAQRIAQIKKELPEAESYYRRSGG